MVDSPIHPTVSRTEIGMTMKRGPDSRSGSLPPDHRGADERGAASRSLRIPTVGNLVYKVILQGDVPSPFNFKFSALALALRNEPYLLLGWRFSALKTLSEAIGQ